MRVTILGLGHMGRVAALRLLQTGHEVTVWNRSPGRTEELTAQGATAAGSVVEAVAGAEVVLTLLTNDAAVRAVCLGSDGAVEHLPDGAVLVDMSTVYPDTSRELSRAVAEGQFVDAPILGGPEAMLNHKGKLLIGGAEGTVQRLAPLWNDLATSWIYTGPNGSATTLKLLSNHILVGGTTLLAEAVTAGQAAGIGDDVLRQVFGESPAVAPGVKVRLEDILAGDHRGWWTLELADKDMTLVLKLAADVDRTLPLAATTDDMIRQAIAAGYGNKDLGAIVELVRNLVPARA